MPELDVILTKSTAQAVGNETRNRLLLWTVYESPRDFPGLFIIRPHEADPQYRPLMCHIEANSLDEARAMLPAGLTNIGKDKRDDPKIVEVWI